MTDFFLCIPCFPQGEAQIIVLILCFEISVYIQAHYMSNGAIKLGHTSPTDVLCFSAIAQLIQMFKHVSAEKEEPDTVCEGRHLQF